MEHSQCTCETTTSIQNGDVDVHRAVQAIYPLLDNLLRFN